MIFKKPGVCPEIIKHICLNQERFSCFYSSQLKNVDFESLLERLYQMQAPSLYKPVKTAPHVIYYYYSIYTLIDKIQNIDMNEDKITRKIASNPIDLDDFYLSELKKSTNFLTSELYQVLTVPDFQINPAKFTFNLSRFMKKDAGLFRCLKDKFWKILNSSKFTKQDLLKYFGVSIFDMNDHIDYNLLNSINLIKIITNSNLASFLQTPAFFQTDKTINFIQSVLCCNEPFPGYSKLFNENNLLTLVNDAILKRNHFTEIILKCGLTFSCSFNKMKSLTENCGCQEFLPCFYLLIDQPLNDFYTSNTKISDQFNSFDVDLSELMKLDDSKFCNIFKRVYGDQQLFNFLKTTMGTIVDESRINNNSFIFLMQPIISQISTESLIDFSTLMYYSITDADKLQDFEFLFAFRLMSDIISNKTQSISRLFRKLLSLRNGSVKDKNVNPSLKPILIDIFSILFTKNKETNKFIVSFETAEEVISYLSAKLPDHVEIFTAAAKKISLGKLLVSSNKKNKGKKQLNNFSSNSIDACFLTPKDIFVILMKKKEFAKASKVAKENEYYTLQEMAEIGNAIESNIKYFYSPPIQSKSVRNLFNIEYGLSTNQDLEYVLTMCSFSYDIKALLSKRENLLKISDPLYPISKVGKLVNEASNFLKSFETYNLNVGDEDLTQGNNIDFLSKFFKDDIQLPSFIKFIQNLDHCIKLEKKYHFKDIFNSKSVENLIDLILCKSENYEEFIEIFTYEGSNENALLDNILRFSKTLEHQEKLIKFMMEKFPIVGITLQLFSNKPKLSLSTSPVIKKYSLQFSKNPTSSLDEELDEILLFGDHSKKTQQLIDFRLMHWFDFDYNDIMNNKESKYNRMINKIIQNITFQEFIDIFPEFRDTELEKITTSSGDPVQVLEDLIEKNDVLVALHYSQIFQVKDILIDLICKKIILFQNQNNEEKISIIFKFWNSLKNEIFEKLPVQYHDLNAKVNILQSICPVNLIHPELPVLSKFPFLNFDNDLIRIFDFKLESKITRKIHSSSKFYDNYAYKFMIIDEFVNHYLQYFKSCEKIINEKVCRTLFSIVDSITVNSFEDEMMSVRILDKVIQFLKQIKLRLFHTFKNFVFQYELQISMIKCLFEFVKLSFFTHYNICFSLSKFSKSSLNKTLDYSFPLFFINLCCLYDFNKLFYAFVQLWNVDVESFIDTYFEQIKKSYQLEQYSSTTEMIEKLSFFFPKQSLPYTHNLIPTEIKQQLLITFSTPPFFNVNELTNDKIIPITNKYDQIKNIIQNKSLPKLNNINDSSNIMKFDNEINLKISNLFIKEIFTPIEKIPIHTIKRNFAEAFDTYFYKLPNNQKTPNVVLIDIFFTALNSFCYDDLLKFIFKFREDRNFIDLFNDIINILRKMKMKTTLIDFLQHLQYYEKVIKNLVDIIIWEESKWDNILYDLKILIETIQKEISNRVNFQSNKVNYFSHNDLNDILRKCGLQCNFVLLCIEKNIPFSKDLILFRNSKSKDAMNNNDINSSLRMPALALFHYKFNLGFQIAELITNSYMNADGNSNMNNDLKLITSNNNVVGSKSTPNLSSIHPPIQLNAVLFKICELLMDMLDDNHISLSSYFIQMNKKLDRETYEIFSTILCKIISGRAINTRDIPLFVESDVVGERLQTKILIQLGFLEEAFNIAMKIKDRHLIENIEFQARVSGNRTIQVKCRKFLTT